MNHNKNIEEKLAGSLTAETTELIPYLPYLLQDIWELGSIPEDMIMLVKQNIDISSDTKIIDLGCGKGAVSVLMCKELGIHAFGFDLLPGFIETAREKAEEFHVQHLCEFHVQDINETVKIEQGYDLAILGAVGDALGEPAETLHKLKGVIHRKGYILMDEAYLAGEQDDVRYQNYEYLTRTQWKKLIHDLDLKVIAEITLNDTAITDDINDYNNRMISRRADELIRKYPDKSSIFEGYVNSQLMECEDLTDVITGVTWLLRKR